MKKILASDYDGTFYLNDSDIQNNINEIRKFRKNGNIFLIATGNNYEAFMKPIRKYNIEYDYLVLDDGGAILNKDGKMIYTTFIEPKVVKELYEMIKNESDNIAEFSQWKMEKEYKEENITKISTRIKDVNKAKKLTQDIKEKFGNYVNVYTMIFDEINIVEAISCKIDKMKAIELIAEIENVHKNNIYAVGDGYNDIMMINLFNGYCMENSVKELLDICPNKVKNISSLIKHIEKSQ